MLTSGDALAFVHALEMPEVPRLLYAPGAQPTMVTEKNEAAYVDAGSLVSFVEGVPLQHKHDVLNSLLLAQLAATKKYDREEQTDDWYRFYRSVLENVGWVVGAFDFAEYSASGAAFTADKVILKILEAVATGADLAIVAATMDALNSLSNDNGALTVFDHQSHAASRGSFQVCAAAETDGVVVIKIGAFHFQTTENVTRVLWFRFKSGNTSFYKAAQVMNLDDEVYVKVREAVVEKLGRRATTFVKNIEI